MHHFHYIGDELYCESVRVLDVARAVGTPFYLYSMRTLHRHFRAFDDAFEGTPHLTCFSVKSNSNLAVLRLFAREGGGVDIVSGGELYRACKAGVDPRKIVFSGVGKRAEDMADALAAGILMFNTESVQEIRKLNEVAGAAGKQAPIAIRVNPDVDPGTHPYISTGLRENKFGIDIHDAVEQYEAAAGLPHLRVRGVSCHIGSQLTEITPFVAALAKVKDLIRELKNRGIAVDYLDLGGGLGITYDREAPPHPGEYAAAVTGEIDDPRLTLILEPGRVIAGNAGILVTKVLFTKASKEKTFFIVDAGMNDLMRPTLYNSYHAIRPVRQSPADTIMADVVGPICESGDFFAKARELPAFEPGDLAAIMSAGAYGFTMASNYNSRPRVCEILVNGDQFEVIRAREGYEDLIRGERIPEFLK